LPGEGESFIIYILWFSTVFLLLLVLILTYREMKQAKKKLKTILGRTLEGYITLDGSGCFSEANRAFCRMSGFEAEEIIGRPFTDLFQVQDPNFWSELESKGEEFSQNYETCLRTKSGETLHVLCSATAVKKQQEPHSYYFAFISDISQLKQAEEEIRNYTAEIERQHRELEQAKNRAEEANRFKSEFLATMSHEIRTPMSGVVTMTEMLLETPLTEEQQKYASIIRDSSEILLNIINDILDISKIDAGRLELQEREFSLEKLMQKASNINRVRAQEKGLEFHVSVSRGIPEILRGDPLRLRQVLLNLISNAIKFTRQGEVAVEVSPVQDFPDTIVLEFSVQDTGVGIPEERKERVFEPFTQLDSSMTRQYGGTGLGLAISRRLVEMMGGEIGVHSSEGQGSTFWFTVPLKKTRLPSTALEESPRKDHFTSNIHIPEEMLQCPILVVEDNPVNQEIARIQLEKTGFHKIDLATNGKEAVQACRLKPYSLILMDCQMPVMDGYTASRKIRSLEKERGTYTPIVAMTAHSLEGDREKCLEAGMDDYISKPVKIHVLKQALERWLKAGFSGDGAGRESSREEDGRHQAGSGRVQETAEQVLDFQVLEGVTGLPREQLYLLKDVFEIFQQKTPERLNELQQFIDRNEAEGVRAAAHALKSSSSGVGAAELSRLCRDMERLAREGLVNPREARELLQQMEEECSRVCQALEKIKVEP